MRLTPAQEFIRFLLCILFVWLLLTLSSCSPTNACYNNGNGAKMTQGHPKEAFEQKASNNPYYVKAKKEKSHYRNPMK